ncbi:MAG: hypothetical protein IPF48_02790 [Sphingomonadales bacterium]|nr:hypothetical protein [Sphingomonadales bacterium]
MRALCKVLDEIDLRSAARESRNWALVVREGDGLPGQGWWVGRRDYAGAWTGPEARAFCPGPRTRPFLLEATCKGQGMIAPILQTDRMILSPLSLMSGRLTPRHGLIPG